MVSNFVGLALEARLHETLKSRGTKMPAALRARRSSFSPRHLGVTKTYQIILKHFFWPGLKKDVSNFCRCCHVCQVVGKPNQKVPQAPLHPIPAIGEPFDRVLIDCVGPLPRTKTGQQYLFTIMCTSTRFPEAIPHYFRRRSQGFDKVLFHIWNPACNLE